MNSSPLCIRNSAQPYSPCAAWPPILSIPLLIFCMAADVSYSPTIGHASISNVSQIAISPIVSTLLCLRRVFSLYAIGLLVLREKILTLRDIGFVALIIASSP